MAKNLIVYAGNYSDVNGTSWGLGNYACNYPMVMTDSGIYLFTASLVNGETKMTISGGDSFTSLMGCDLSNNNTPLYKWITTDTPTPPLILEVRSVESSTIAYLAKPFDGTTGDYSFSIVNTFGQPRVKQSYATDATAGYPNPCVIYTKYGATAIIAGGAPVPLGSEPVLVNMSSDFSQYGLNIQYA